MYRAKHRGASRPSRNQNPVVRLAMSLLAVTTVLLWSVSAGTVAADAASPTAAPASSAASSTASPAKPTPAAGNHSQATFGIGAASAKGLDGRPYLRYFSSPGGRTADHIELENFDTRPVTLNVYPVDASNGSDGQIAYGSKDVTSQRAGRWMTVRIPGRKSTITLAPRSYVIVPIQLDVPADATPGDHAAGVIASLTATITSSSGPVNFEQRIALRTFIRVSGPLKPGLAVERLNASFGGGMNAGGTGSVRLTYRVHNTGNVELGGSQQVAVSGPFGHTGSPVAVAGIPLLLPDATYDVSVLVPHVRAEGPMTAKVTIRPAALPSDADPALGNIVAATSFVAVPWLPTAVVLLAGLLIAAGLLLRSRLRRRPQGRHGRKPTRGIAAEPQGVTT